MVAEHRVQKGPSSSRTWFSGNAQARTPAESAVSATILSDDGGDTAVD
jgi:hypothetical protein